MDPDFADLVPLFVEESRDRLERLTGSLGRLAFDAEALVEARRELHTLKGAGRMLRLQNFAELCHAGEELLHRGRTGSPALSGAIPLLLKIGDQLSAMVDEVAHGNEIATDDPEVMAFLASLPPSMLPRRGPGLSGRLSAPAITEPSPGAQTPARSAAPVAPLVPMQPVAPVESVPVSVPNANDVEGGERREPRAPSRRSEVRLDSDTLDAVAERATQVRILAIGTRPALDRIYELSQLAEEGVREPQPGQVLAVLASMLRQLAVDVEASQRRLIRASDEQLEATLALQMQPLRGSLHGFARYARELARSLGREVEVTIEGEDTRLDRRITREVEEAVLHLVRNAVDHGIEPPEVREARGKRRAGSLRIRATSTGSRVQLLIEDDGGGIDAKRVVEQAIAGGFIDTVRAASLAHDEVLHLLFMPGFSTRRRVSEISGRGVGLDVVAANLERIGGEILLETTVRKGTTVTLSFPVARRGETVVLLRIGQLRLGLSSSVIRHASRLTRSAVIERDGQSLARVDDRLVPFVSLSRLYGQPEGENLLLLEGFVSGSPLAIAVDGVEREQEVLVRPLPSRLVGDRLLEGIALLASGEPVGILAASTLARRESLGNLRMAPSGAMVKRVRVLLVDDSLVTREMERRLLEDAGFEVAAAVDASEALSRLGEENFDCVVTDIEMPRMDGFALTAQLRGMEQFAHLPIVVVSTRDRPEDRLRGLQAGADAYLTKQSLDAGELVELVRRLSGH
jgi:two-component system chemotaxis sensor kinase CheA